MRYRSQPRMRHVRSLADTNDETTDVALSADRKGVSCLAFNHNGLSLVSGGREGAKCHQHHFSSRLWFRESRILGVPNQALCCAVSADGKMQCYGKVIAERRLVLSQCCNELL
uniref:ANAPC4_WD40 domain-containing protein n=1 Tax=Angiostrongylus cantonensis TaxID=6313 RepID=A0A0K0DMA3_ANGCA